MGYEGMTDEQLEENKRDLDAAVSEARESMRAIGEEQERRAAPAEAERLAAKAAEEEAARARGEYVAPTQHIG